MMVDGGLVQRHGGDLLLVGAMSYPLQRMQYLSNIC